MGVLGSFCMKPAIKNLNLSRAEGMISKQEIKQQIPIVNDRDVGIGYKFREEITKEDIYRVSALWVTNSQVMILLAKRALTKKNSPGEWGPAVSGTVDKGETYEGNIYREAEEELGLN